MNLTKHDYVDLSIAELSVNKLLVPKLSLILPPSLPACQTQGRTDSMHVRSWAR
jgi:hypothetical protein